MFKLPMILLFSIQSIISPIIPQPTYDGRTNILDFLEQNPYFQDQLPKTVEISLVGDVSLGSSFGKFSPLDAKLKVYGESYFFKNVSSIFQNDDLTIMNFESPLTSTNDYTRGKVYTYKGKPENISIFNNSGIDCANVVSNHMHDFKQAGFNETLDILKNNNISYFGTNVWNNKSVEIGSVYIDAPLIKEINGIKVGLLGYTGFNNTQAFKDKVKQDVSKLKSQTDYVIVSMHWGGQNTKKLTNSQVELGHFLIDAGADLVYGHHPHTLQQIETYKGKKIMYSLGNFLFNEWSNPRDRLSVIMQLKLTKTNNIVNDSLTFVPIYWAGKKTGENTLQPTVIESPKDIQTIEEVLRIKR